MATVSKPHPGRLGKCEICKKDEGRYTCPACKVISCGLQCVKKHKLDTDCDGVRSRTAFLKVNQFTELDLLNDYRLLEEIARKVDTCETDGLNAHHLESISMGMNKLKMAIMDRGAKLIFLPKKFHQRSTNTSYLDGSGVVNWRIQLNFLNAQKLVIHEDRCAETMTIRDLIEKYFQKSSQLPESIHQRLSCYRSAGLESTTVLMKAEKVPLSDKKFYKLDLEKTLKENLVGKVIVEFPQLFILINGFFKTEKTKLERGLKDEQNKGKHFLLSEENTSPPPIPMKKLKAEKPVQFSDSSTSGSEDELDLEKAMILRNGTVRPRNSLVYN